MARYGINIQRFEVAETVKEALDSAHYLSESLLAAWLLTLWMFDDMQENSLEFNFWANVTKEIMKSKNFDGFEIIKVFWGLLSFKSRLSPS